MKTICSQVKYLSFALNVEDFNNRYNAFRSCVVFVASATGVALLQLHLCDFNISFSYEKQEEDHTLKNTSGIHLKFAGFLMTLILQIPGFFSSGESI